MGIPERPGLKRRYIMERMWQAMLGCPQDLGTKKTLGCRAEHGFPEGGVLQRHACLEI